MKGLLETEKEGKNRSTLIRWLKFGIKQEELPTEFFLGYRGKVSILKSALQKYIRRGETEKALSSGKFLYLLAKSSAVNRLKIMVVEDAATSVALVGYLNESTSLPQFLGCVKALSNAPKSKKYVSLIQPLTEVENPRTTSFNGALKEITQLYQMIKDGRVEVEEVFKVIDRNAVTESLINRAVKGTYFIGDSLCLIAAAIDYSQTPTECPELIEISPSEVEAIKFADIDWYCLDFHTPVGRTALDFFIHHHPRVNRREMEEAWFMGESAKLGGEVVDVLEANCSRELWNKYKNEVKELVEYCKEHKYKLQDY